MLWLFLNSLLGDILAYWHMLFQLSSKRYWLKFPLGASRYEFSLCLSTQSGANEMVKGQECYRSRRNWGEEAEEIVYLKNRLGKEVIKPQKASKNHVKLTQVSHCQVDLIRKWGRCFLVHFPSCIYFHAWSLIWFRSSGTDFLDILNCRSKFKRVKWCTSSAANKDKTSSDILKINLISGLHCISSVRCNS